MKKVIIVCVVSVLMILMVFIYGCNEAQKSPTIRPIEQQILLSNQQWKDTYGDKLESQIVFNLAVVRSDILKIALVMNALHPADVNDPNNLMARIEILEEKAIMDGDDTFEIAGNGSISKSRGFYIFKTDVNDPGKMARERKRLEEKDKRFNSDNPKEGQIRWIPDTWRKKGYLELYDGKEWIVR